MSDEVWADLRAAAGSRPLASLLAELVELEVRRYRRGRMAEGSMLDRELVAALAEAKELQADLAAVVAGLERRLDQRATPPIDVYE